MERKENRSKKRGKSRVTKIESTISNVALKSPPSLSGTESTYISKYY